MRAELVPQLVEARLEDELALDQPERHLQQRGRRGRQRVHPRLRLRVELGRGRRALAEQREHSLHRGEHHALQLVLHQLRHLPEQPLHERAVVLVRPEARGEVGVAHAPLDHRLLREHPLRLEPLAHRAQARLLRAREEGQRRGPLDRAQRRVEEQVRRLAHPRALLEGLAPAAEQRQLGDEEGGVDGVARGLEGGALLGHLHDAALGHGRRHARGQRERPHLPAEVGREQAVRELRAAHRGVVPG